MSKTDCEAEPKVDNSHDHIDLLQGQSLESLAESGIAGQRTILDGLNKACAAESSAIVDHHRGLKVHCAKGDICASLRGIALQVCHASQKGGGRLVTHYSRGYHLYCTSIERQGLSLVVAVKEDNVIADYNSRVGYKVEMAASYLQECLQTSGTCRPDQEQLPVGRIDFTAIQGACDAEIAVSQLADGLLAAMSSTFVAVCGPRKSHRRGFPLQALAMQGQLKSQLIESYQVADRLAGNKRAADSMDPHALALLSECCAESSRLDQPISCVFSEKPSRRPELPSHFTAGEHFQVESWVTYPLYTNHADSKILGYVLWGDTDVVRAKNNFENFEAMVYDISFTLQVFHQADRGWWARLRDCWESFQYANL